MTTQDEILQKLQELEAVISTRQLSAEELGNVEESLQALEGIVSPRPPRKSTIRDLKGLGKEIWRSIDVDEYIREERRSWR